MAAFSDPEVMAALQDGTLSFSNLSIYMCVCMCVCAYVYIYIRMYVCACFSHVLWFCCNVICSNEEPSKSCKASSKSQGRSDHCQDDEQIWWTKVKSW